jgi:hypothetical protein
MDRETSARVSSIAARLLEWAKDPNDLDDQTLADIKSVAASVLSQDETPGQEPSTFLDRLKIEHAHLTGKHDALTLFLSHATPNVSDEQRALLELQLGAMGLYRRLLELRLANLELETTNVE